jgi:N utilization substance protein A
MGRRSEAAMAVPKDMNLQVILQQLQAEKSVDRETLIEAIRSAIETAARKSFAPTATIAVEMNASTLEWKVFELREVVEQVQDAAKDMSLEQAKLLNPAAIVGDVLKVPAEPKDFGRIAAQTAKQVIIQRLKDAERDNVYDEFKKRQGELVTGVVKRYTHGNLIVSVGRAEAIVPQKEQSPRDNFKPNERVRAYVLLVDKSVRGPQIILSRTSSELVRALFEQEVPEIYDGTVTIRAIAREAGSRTKIAVSSKDPNVDPVGACVGMKGSRVRAVVEELNGEKLDIVRWSDDPVEMCGNALNPADILDITVDEDTKSILVIVPHDQLSLAIGKRGQNARLASKLMGWNIDIKSDVEITGGEVPAEEGSVAQATAEQPAEAPGRDAAEPARSAGDSAEEPEKVG